VPSGHRWWISPDIWVHHQPDGGLVHQNPVALQENTVYARLRNSGQQAASGRVDVYWSRSRIGWPCKFWSPNVGSIDFVNLAPGEVRILSLSWTPQQPGHHGLHTVIEADGDPADKSLPCSPHQPRWDNNVSWHNVIVYYHPHRSGLIVAGEVEATVDIVNIYDRPKDVDLFFEMNTFAVTGTVTFRLPGGLFDRWLASPRSWSTGATILTDTQEIVISGVVSATLGGLPLQNYEQSAGQLLFVGPYSGEFEVVIYEQIDGLAIGGVTYNWTVTDVIAPQVTGYWPLDEVVDVDLATPLVVMFDEEIGPLNFNLILEPEKGMWGLISNEARTIFTTTHATLTPATRYTVTVTAADAFANPMNSPYSWSFTTRPQWTVCLPLLNRP
jgi:hypothetical protein